MGIANLHEYRDSSARCYLAVFERLSGAIAIALQQRNGFKKNCCGHQKV
jgi:hypothetical protein